MEGRRRKRRDPRSAARSATRILKAAGAALLLVVFLLQPAAAAARPALDAVAQSLDTSFDTLLSCPKLAPGDSISDWIALVTGRCGGSGETYLKGLEAHVTDTYRKDGGLDRAKATEWHRISLTVLALGGDPTAFGKDSSGTPINLIADGTYNWHTTDTLGTQGLNAWIFALITLDSKAYAVAEDAAYTRQTLLQNILDAQEPDGGFGLNRGGSNLDITAMALQALAPYQNSTKHYSLSSGEDTTVMDTIDRALSYLRQQQTEDGSFGNSCSTAQVVVALCSLGIDPDSFAEQGCSAREGLLSYQTEEGLFRYLPEDSSYDLMSTEQVILALTAMDRLDANDRRIFDFRPEMDADAQQQIRTLNEEIALLTPEQLVQQSQSLCSRYTQIPAAERSYVTRYRQLAEAMERSGLPVPEEDPALAYDLTPPTPVKRSHTIQWVTVSAVVLAAAAAALVVFKKGKQKHV